MYVINLLPWRQAMYRRNRRRFILMLLGVTCFALILALTSYCHGRQDRRIFDTKLASLQAGLSDLEQDNIVLLQTSDEIAAINKKLQSKTLEWMRQREWQHQMQVWQWLARDARISAITWSGEEIRLQAVSETTDAVRKLIHNFPDWQLQQIELNARSRYQFLVSSALSTEVGL